MKKIMFITFLAVILAACVPVTTPAPTETPIPTFTPVPPTFTPTATFVFPTPSPMPTQPPPPILTPDVIQVERWQEYQTELAKALFTYNPAFPQWRYGPDIYKDAICEWDILGRSDQELYLWTACISADGLSLRMNPVVIYLESDGSILEVNVAREEADYSTQLVAYDLHLFPTDIQEKLCLYNFSGHMPQCHEILPAYPFGYEQSREGVLVLHLKYRKDHTEEPPLVTLSAMSTATPMP